MKHVSVRAGLKLERAQPCRAPWPPDQLGLPGDPTGISKFVEYIGDHVPVVRPSPRSEIALRIIGDDIEQPLQVLNLPSAAKDPQIKSGTGTADPDPTGEPARSSHMSQVSQPKAPSIANPLPAWLWPVTAVALLAGAAQWLWLNRKKHK